MRTRLLPFGTAMALALGLLTATPAAATYAVASISFPGSEFYSPFTGPATVTFTFDGSENDATFELRLRPVGGTAIHRKLVFIDPDTQPSPRAVSFSWPALTAGSAKTFEVAVYRDGKPLGAPESFLLRPPLVSITGATPNPFFPWIDNGHKDTTNVRFDLAADAVAQARVFRPNSAGKCCGVLVRSDDLGSFTAGNNWNWIWDGTNENGTNLGKGNYFVRISADDGVVAPALSKAMKVTIARTYRATTTRSKTANAYHHVGPVTPLVLGGDCIIYRSSSLQVLCQGGRVSVYWRWGLASDERIERASFVLDTVEGCPPSIRRTGHTKHESSFTMNEDLPRAAGDCRLVTARITYSHPEQS
jgi:hypothetical protein